MEKQAWRVLNEKNKLWVRLLEVKYDKCEDWLKHDERKKGSVWWRDSRKLCQLDVDKGWLNKKLYKKLGNGLDIKFWESIQLGQEPMKISYKRLFLNSSQQEQFICEMGEWAGEEWR